MAVVTFKHMIFFLFGNTCIYVVLFFCHFHYMYKLNNDQISTLALHDLYEFPSDLTIKDKYNWTYTGQFHQNYSKFAPALNATEYRWYTRLVREFVQRCEDFNITFMLKGGTVHGACMYHGFVPWDDDVDVHVLHSHKQRLQSAFNSSHTHILGQYGNYQWKVWSKNESINTRKRWNWPYIDIFFFRENGTQVYDYTKGFPKQYYPKGDIFPLQIGLFENIFVPVPNNMTAYLERLFGFDVSEKKPCNQFDHKKEKHKWSRVTISNYLLFHVYPRVYRNQSKGYSYEELRLGNTILYKTKFPIKGR